jgi:hypothetical protein
MDLYVPPPVGTLPVDFGADHLGSIGFSGPFQAFPAEATITPEGTRLVLGQELRAFSINRATGLFSGKATLTVEPALALQKNVTVSFKGAVLQSMQRGTGYYTFGKKTGFVRFSAD